MDDIDLEFDNASSSTAPVSARELLGRDIFEIPDEIVQGTGIEDDNMSVTDLLNEYQKDDKNESDEMKSPETVDMNEKESEDEDSSSKSSEVISISEGSKKREDEEDEDESESESESESEGEDEEEKKDSDDDEVDWDSVNQQTIEKSQNEDDLESITTDECLTYFIGQLDVKDEEEEEEDEEEEEKKIGVIEQLLRAILCIPLPEPLSHELTKERENIQKILKFQLDHSNDYHKRMMFSMYKLVKREDKNPPIIGEHWVDVGFQRNDPKTDLRGSGVFGIIQLLNFLQTNQDLAVRIYEASKIPGNPFPFACVSLNWTASTLRLLNQGKLDYLIRQRQSVSQALNLAYMSIFFEFIQRWEKEGWTVRDYGSAKNEITKFAMKNIKKMIEKLEKEE